MREVLRQCSDSVLRALVGRATRTAVARPTKAQGSCARITRSRKGLLCNATSAHAWWSELSPKQPYTCTHSGRGTRLRMQAGFRPPHLCRQFTLLYFLLSVRAIKLKGLRLGLARSYWQICQCGGNRVGKGLKGLCRPTYHHREVRPKWLRS